MKFNPNERYNTIAVYILIVIIFTILCVIFCMNFDKISAFIGSLIDVAKPLIYAFFFAFFLAPLRKFCDSKLLFFIGRKKPRKKLKKILSVILAYIIALGFLVFFGFIIVPQIMESYTDLQSKIGGYVTYTQNWIEEMIGTSEFFAEQYAKVIDTLQDLISDSYKLFEKVSPYAIEIIGKTLTETKNILLGMVFSIYFLISKDTLIAQMKKIFRAFLPDSAYKQTLRIGELTNITFNEYIIGKALDAILMGLVCYILMLIFNMPYAPLVSLMIGVTAFIPFIGMYIGAIPGMFIVFIASPIKVFGFLLIVIGLQLLDSNVIEPRILSEKNGLSALWVLTAIILMTGLLGGLGLFIGVPLFTVIYVLCKELIEGKLKKKDMPADTKEYYNS